MMRAPVCVRAQAAGIQVKRSDAPASYSGKRPQRHSSEPHEWADLLLSSCKIASMILVRHKGMCGRHTIL